jgi:hypothetical protein
MLIVRLNSISRLSKIILAMHAVLYEFLDIRLDRERSKIIDYFKDKFNIIILKRLISYTLEFINWIRKVFYYITF